MSVWSGVLYMAYSDRVILEALKQQLNKRGPDSYITYNDLVIATGASRATVQRSLRRLMTTGVIAGTLRHKYGYQYRICDEHE